MTVIKFPCTVCTRCQSLQVVLKRTREGSAGQQSHGTAQLRPDPDLCQHPRVAFWDLLVMVPASSQHSDPHCPVPHGRPAWPRDLAPAGTGNVLGTPATAPGTVGHTIHQGLLCPGHSGAFQALPQLLGCAYRCLTLYCSARTCCHSKKSLSAPESPG